MSEEYLDLFLAYIAGELNDELAKDISEKTQEGGEMESLGRSIEVLRLLYEYFNGNKEAVKKKWFQMSADITEMLDSLGITLD